MRLSQTTRHQNKNPAQFLGPGFLLSGAGHRAAGGFLCPLQFRLATQLAASVTTAGAGTVVRLRDFAIVLGHVMSSIWKS